MMNYHKLTKYDIANGVGIGLVLWVSGCSLSCENCHNPQTHDFNSGTPFTKDTMQELLESLDKPYISRLTLSGGHPFESENLETVREIVNTVKQKLPNKTIWIYTGFRWEKVVQCITYSEENRQYDDILKDIILKTDVLVDGRYKEGLRDITLPFRGSSNQRLIDVQATLNSDTPYIPIPYNI